MATLIQVSVEAFLTLLYLKFETSAHAQIVFNHNYILFTSFLTWYEFKNYIGDTLDKWSWSIILSPSPVTFPKYDIWSVNLSQLHGLFKCWHFY